MNDRLLGGATQMEATAIKSLILAQNVPKTTVGVLRKWQKCGTGEDRAKEVLDEEKV